ncbi:MAG: efflux RND transporter periplasmic adaptor subunit [Taibaiella sp.]|nr:efflux RND transporter periplasmic adaptor subunit [Taibaiella sp.]
MKKLTGIAFAALGCSLVFLLSSCGGKKESKEPARPKGPKVLTAEAVVVKAQSFQNNYTTSGTLLANEEVSVMPEVSGRISAISFKEGGAVTQGQVLARLNSEDIRAQIAKLKAQKELQTKIKGRQSELLEIGGISQQEFETTNTTIQGIEADIAYAEAQLRKTTIIAPFSGKAGIRNVSMGAVVTPATVITTLQQTGTLKMDFSVPEQYRNELTAGKKIAFTVTGRLDTFSAIIAAVEPAANTATRTLRVRAMVSNNENKLGPGAFTHVVIPFDHDNNALLIPSQSVIPTNRNKVAAVLRGGKAEMVPIILGTRTADKVEVIQGLAAGDTVLTTGIMQVKPGMQVNAQVREM